MKKTGRALTVAGLGMGPLYCDGSLGSGLSPPSSPPPPPGGGGVAQPYAPSSSEPPPLPPLLPCHFQNKLNEEGEE